MARRWFRDRACEPSRLAVIDFQAARLIVEREMNLRYERAGLGRTERLRVFEEFSCEQAWGWVVYFGDSYADFRGADEQVEYSRYPPCLVSRRGGELSTTGTAWPLEKYIGDFELQLLVG